MKMNQFSVKWHKQSKVRVAILCATTVVFIGALPVCASAASLTIKNKTKFRYICIAQAGALQGEHPDGATLLKCGNSPEGKMNSDGYMLVARGDSAKLLISGSSLRWSVVGVADSSPTDLKLVSFANPFYPDSPNPKSPDKAAADYGNVIATTAEATLNPDGSTNFDISMVNGANFGVDVYSDQAINCTFNKEPHQYKAGEHLIDLPKDQTQSLWQLCDGKVHHGVQTGLYNITLNNIKMCAGISNWVGFNEGNNSPRGLLARCGGPFSTAADYCVHPDQHVDAINQGIASYNAAPGHSDKNIFPVLPEYSQSAYGDSPENSLWEKTTHNQALIHGPSYAYAYDDLKADTTCDSQDFVIEFTSPGSNQPVKSSVSWVNPAATLTANGGTLKGSINSVAKASNGDDVDYVCQISNKDGSSTSSSCHAAQAGNDVALTLSNLQQGEKQVANVYAEDALHHEIKSITLSGDIATSQQVNLVFSKPLTAENATTNSVDINYSLRDSREVPTTLTFSATVNGEKIKNIAPPTVVDSGECGNYASAGKCIASSVSLSGFNIPADKASTITLTAAELNDPQVSTQSNINITPQPGPVAKSVNFYTVLPSGATVKIPNVNQGKALPTGAPGVAFALPVNTPVDIDGGNAFGEPLVCEITAKADDTFEIHKVTGAASIPSDCAVSIGALYKPNVHYINFPAFF